MYDGIIFDVDGTIWDSTPVVQNAWNDALNKAGYSERVTADILRGLFGLPMDDIIRTILPYAEKPQRDQIGEYLYEFEHEYLRRESGYVYEGLVEMMKQLSARYPLFIVSNCQSGYIEVVMEKTGIGEYIRDHLCPGDTGVLKADNIRIISERNGLKNPIYIGDTQMDADACIKAGVPIVYCAYGFGKIEHPDYTIDKPMELLNLL